MPRAANAERAPDGNAEKLFRSIKDLIRRKRTKGKVSFLSQGRSMGECVRPGYPAISQPPIFIPAQAQAIPANLRGRPQRARSPHYSSR